MISNEEPVRRFKPAPWKAVRFTDGFWRVRREVNRSVTIPTEYEQLRKTGRIDAFRLDWRPGMPNPPHIFWESDVAKWLEAAAYVLGTDPDPGLERQVDELVTLIEGAQQPDGYLNIHFTVVEPDKRWTNLRDWHELYCLGHLIEAAVALKEATGDARLLKVMCRAADHVYERFGPHPDAIPGYPGHEEIELALVRLYRATGDRRYLDLSKCFIDRRGTQPNFFEQEALARGEPPEQAARDFSYWQAQLPVREQTEAAGHAVRATYLYCAMADVAAETGDRALLDACLRLWKNVVTRRMYVTGGIGSTASGERFTNDYDLPNDTAYAETCAAIGLILWMHRMLAFRPDARFADILELALYNGALSGVSLDGRRFFYVNPLEVRRREERRSGGSDNLSHVRLPWFGCACCPPNIARLIAGLGRFVYSVSTSDVAVHLYAASDTEIPLRDGRVRILQETDYPWDGRVRLELHCENPMRFGLLLRTPGWAPRFDLSVNGRTERLEPDGGYVRIEREWSGRDEVIIDFEMPVERLWAHPAVRFDCGRTAFRRGPLVYCFEGVDNGNELDRISVPREAEFVAWHDPALLGGVTVLEGEGLRLTDDDWADRLYRPSPPQNRPVRLRAVPYAFWENRALGDMMVWLRESS